MYFFRVFVFVAIILLVPGAVAAASPELKCADFLNALHLKPAHVRFVQCELAAERQGKPLRAIYRVSGVHAAAAEAFLGRAAHLPPLKRSCCIWDGPPGQFTGQDGRIYSLYMVSPETHVKQRRQWRDIPSFEIVVETLTEEI